MKNDEYQSLLDGIRECTTIKELEEIEQRVRKILIKMTKTEEIRWMRALLNKKET